MQTIQTISELKSIPFYSQFSDDQLRAQIRQCLGGIEHMRARALKTGKKVAGFSINEIEKMIDQYNIILGPQI